jgi:hypothetical protein
MKRVFLSFAGVLTACCAVTAATVTTLDDSGPGSLREAVAAGGSVDFAVTGSIILTSGQIHVTSPITITGPGANQLTIRRSGADGTPPFRIFKVSAQTTISGVTINNGFTTETYDDGAGILNENALTLNDCVLRGNRSTSEYSRGVGIYNAWFATLVADRCVFTDNVGSGDYSEGGGVYVYGDVIINDCTFNGNGGSGTYSRGGGLHIDYFGNATVNRCTFSGNAVTGVNAQGAGIYNYGRLDITNSTISGNTSGDTGGGLHVDSLSLGTSIRHCTITANSADEGSGIYINGFLPHDAGEVSIRDSIIAGNLLADEDIDNSGIIHSGGHNLFGSIAGNTVLPGAGDHFNVTPAQLKLGPLADNGGWTQTHALLNGSLAINAASETDVPPTDQRGVARPMHGPADIGAFETIFESLPVLTITATVANTIEPGPLTGDSSPGIFTIHRAVNTNAELKVFFNISGTASNGVDYESLTNFVNIPAGATSAAVILQPLDDLLVEGVETVLIELLSAPCLPIDPPPTDCYVVGLPSRATVKIHDDEPQPNNPPVLIMLSPQNGTTFPEADNIVLSAFANDPEDGINLNVEFFEGTNSIGMGVLLPVTCASLDCPNFALTWSNVPIGSYTLTTVATDNDGLSVTSSPVQILVQYVPVLPTVTIQATDATAMEPGAPDAINPGAFTFYRTGDTNHDLPVFYMISGTASNAVDYINASAPVLIPAGATSAIMPIVALDDNLVEGSETVRFRLIHPPLGSPVDLYRIGTPSNATVTIFDNDYAPEPFVTLTIAGYLNEFSPWSTLRLRAKTLDTNEQATVAFVEFFEGTNRLAVETNYAPGLPPPDIRFYTFVWTNVPAGNHTLTARATETDGTVWTSAPVTIFIDDPIVPPVITVQTTDATASEPGLPAVVDYGVFTISRTGSTNFPQLVYFGLGGTASNTADYYVHNPFSNSIPNTILIPAGRSSGNIYVNALDDSLGEGTETVVLTINPVFCVALHPTPPDCYVVGTPSLAEIQILDNDPIPPNVPAFTINATDGQLFRVECSTNLVHWTPLCTNSVTSGTLHYHDPDAGKTPQRFYRAVPLTP